MPKTGFIEARLSRVRGELVKRGLGACLVTDLRDVRYLSGFTGSSALVVVTRRGGVFLTDPRYALQASGEVKGLKIRVYKNNGLGEAARIIKGLSSGPVGFQGSALSYDAFLSVRKGLAPIRLKPAAGVVSTGRLRKDAFELERIRDSVQLLDRGFSAVQRLLKPGVTEKEAALRVEASMKRLGAEALAFDTIVASGRRGALPHGKASDKGMRKGELVTVDMGVRLNGYNSDETRTFSIGMATARQRKVHRAVLDALLYATEKIRAGVPAFEVDRAARGRIRKAGFGKYFTHSTGHGVGLDVHEGPVIGPKSKDVLEEGMVVTVEPGIYIPGWGGVRIEDMVAVRTDGGEVLTRTPRELICL